LEDGDIKSPVQTSGRGKMAGFPVRNGTQEARRDEKCVTPPAFDVFIDLVPSAHALG